MDGTKKTLRIAVTGSPGIGKSTVVAKVAEKLAKQQGFKIGGIQTVEIRSKGQREGFSIMDLATGKAGTLSHIKGNGPRFGKYRINLEDLEEIGAKALRNALSCNLVVIDEIGPMELISESFVDAVEDILESDKPVLAVLHHSSRHLLAQRIRKEFEVLTVNKENRDELPEMIFNCFASQIL
jgi:nucleoside-triphosphatase